MDTAASLWNAKINLRAVRLGLHRHRAELGAFLRCLEEHRELLRRMLELADDGISQLAELERRAARRRRPSRRARRAA